jgi:acetoin utilization deacetylase AcuC-like enzyme
MKTMVLHHDNCLRHDMGPRQVERPERVGAVLGAVREKSGIELLPAPRATADQLQLAHPSEYWQTLIDLEPGEGSDERVALDYDTFLSSGSIDAALRGSGAICFAIDQLREGKARNAFCVTRPPGHHAEASRAMGFCLINHVAVGAHHALVTGVAERVAIVDFDVHHGNGTQAIFEEDPEVLFVSSHQMPLYPGTGSADETGCGNVVNMPLAPGDGSRAFREVWSRRGLPAVERFRPDLILVSTGFDAHQRDPLGQLLLQDEDYEWITTEIRALADGLCGGRMVSMLEGGYDLDALASASAAHVEALTAA